MDPITLRLNDDDGHICTNGPDDVRCPMMITDYVQLFAFALY